jgi:hypothetical protein
MENLQVFKEKKNEDILRSMIDYLNFKDEDSDDDFDCGYTQESIDKCAAILDNYIDELEKCKQDKTLITGCVKNVILALNALNEECDCSIIETDQREYLCPFIEDAAVAAGLPRPEDDITEEWREW